MKQHSGVYIFRPNDGEFDSHPYGTFTSIGVAIGSIKSQLVITFTGGADGDTGDTLVRISIEDLPVLRFDVELHGVPYDKKIGHEVTVNFITPEIDNQNVFYTDSNGLAMQRRQLNYRPTWDLELPTNQNITANYYPI
jgi:lysosomal alpha-mannosidase